MDDKKKKRVNIKKICSSLKEVECFLNKTNKAYTLSKISILLRDLFK